MDNHMDNNPNGNRPDKNKSPGNQDPNKNHQSILAFLVSPPDYFGMFCHVYQYAQG